MFDNIEEDLRRQRENVERLRTEPCMDIPVEGQHILVNAGAVNRGHAWVPIEAKVLRVAHTAYFVEFLDRYYEDKAWISPIVVQEVLPLRTEEKS